MTPKKIFSILDLARRARNKGFIFNPCFSGAPGLGKTEIVQQWAKENKLPFIVLTPALYEAPDMKGFPFTRVIDGKQRQSYATPDFWPDSGSGIIILEEWNRGTPSIMNTIMSLTDTRRGFDGFKLPEGWIVAGCINEGAEYEVNTIDPALRDRWDFFPVLYDKHTFLEYMDTTGWDKTIQLFVESNTWTYSLPEDIKDTPGSRYIAPRTLSKLNAVIASEIKGDDELMVYENILGKNVGKAFFHFKHNEQPVLYSDIIKNKKSALKKLQSFSDPKNTKSAYISITIKDLVENDQNKNSKLDDDLLVEILLAMPTDQGPALLRELEYTRKDTTLSNRVIGSYPELKKYLGSILVVKSKAESK